MSTFPARHEVTAPGDSSVPEDNPLDPAEPRSNIDPREDQTGDTTAAAAGTLPIQVATRTETFGPGETPADSVSLGTKPTFMPVAADPARTAAQDMTEALSHPSVSVS